MATKIRLARGGSKKRPHYSIVVTDSRMPRDGRFLEKLGTYDPMLAKDNEKRVVMNLDRIKELLAQGAQPTDRVARFLAQAGLVKWEHGNNPQKAVPGQKAKERAEERAQRETDRAAAAAEAAAQPAPEPEPVVEEAPAAEAPAAEAPAAEEAAPAAAEEAAPADAEKTEG